MREPPFRQLPAERPDRAGPPLCSGLPETDGELDNLTAQTGSDGCGRSRIAFCCGQTGALHCARKSERQFVDSSSNMAVRRGKKRCPHMLKLTLFSASSKLLPRDPPLHGPDRQGNTSGKPRRGDAPFLSRLRNERNRRTGASRRPRRIEAGAPPYSLREIGRAHV